MVMARSSLREPILSGPSDLISTPTAPELVTRPGDFATLGEALDHAALGPLGALPAVGPASLPPPGPAGLCYLQFSSGSTRFPVGVAVSQSALMANITAIGGPDGLSVTGKDRAVSWLPLYHDMGLVGMLLTS